MELKKEELEQLKAMVPNVEADFPTEAEVMKEVELSIQTTQVFIDHRLMDLLKSHESRLKDKQTIISANITPNGKYRTRYELNPKKVKADIKAATEQALKARENDIEQAKAQALDGLISDRLAALQAEREAKQEKEKSELKEKLLQQLFS